MALQVCIYCLKDLYADDDPICKECNEALDSIEAEIQLQTIARKDSLTAIKLRAQQIKETQKVLEAA